jgi:hypothetical protein
MHETDDHKRHPRELLQKRHPKESQRIMRAPQENEQLKHT